MPCGSNRSAQNPVPGLRPLPGSDDVAKKPLSLRAYLNFNMQTDMRKEWLRSEDTLNQHRPPYTCI